jgi:hypothetical protein
MLEIQFHALLSGTSTITSLAVGGVYPVTLPKDWNTFPAIHWMIVGGSSAGTFDSYGVQEYRIEVNCWGDSYNDAVTLRHAVISVLAGYSDANMAIRLLMTHELFDPDFLECRAIAEFYVTSNFSN